MAFQKSSLIEILRWRATNQSNRIAYRFLPNGESDEIILTYEQLDQKARSFGAFLQSLSKTGDRVLIFLPPGLEFITAFLSCLYAKVIAVPAYYPHPLRLEKYLPMIDRLVDDCEPSAVFVNASLSAAITSNKILAAKLSYLKFIVVNDIWNDDQSAQWLPPEIGLDHTAFLQYTSGSTSTPRGVIISHGNLLHNMEFIERCFGLSNESQAMSWLPPYHDMGLIGGILQPLFTGCPVTLMPNLMFLQRPFRWLKAISRLKCTISGGPNFAYDLCVKKITPEQRDLLDLSSWEVAFNGAEPINPETLDRFEAYFAPCGFRRENFFPCYGLAESTLMVVGGPKSSMPVMQNPKINSLEQGKAIISTQICNETQRLVSCGKNLSDQKVLIVNTDTLTRCADDEIGEIWVSGSSVAKGYWNNPKETSRTFNGRLVDNKEESFLRTGDLGFIHQDELYITGRRKTIVIHNGKNHYAHDLERTVEACHPVIRPAGCAVFSICQATCEQLIVIAEIEYKSVENAEEIIKSIRRAVAINHEIPVHDVRLTFPGGISKTTSGKKMHYDCKRNYLNNTLKEITIP